MVEISSRRSLGAGAFSFDADGAEIGTAENGGDEKHPGCGCRIWLPDLRSSLFG